MQIDVRDVSRPTEPGIINLFIPLGFSGTATAKLMKGEQLRQICQDKFIVLISVDYLIISFHIQIYSKFLFALQFNLNT